MRGNGLRTILRARMHHSLHRLGHMKLQMQRSFESALWLWRLSYQPSRRFWMRRNVEVRSFARIAIGGTLKLSALHFPHLSPPHQHNALGGPGGW